MMYHCTPERFNVCRLIVNNDLSLLDKFSKEHQISLCEINDNFLIDKLVKSILSESFGLSERDNFKEFDLLIFVIKCNISLPLIEYIVEKTPYIELNYGRMENKNNFDVPLFNALANNRFDISDYLKQKGTSLNYKFFSHQFQVDEDYSGHLNFCGYMERELFDYYNYYYHIEVDLYRFLCGLMNKISPI